MSLAAVQSFAKDLLGGITSQFYPGAPLIAYVAPPAVSTIEGPTLYIWGGHILEERIDLPRGNKTPGSGGQKTSTIDLEMFLYTIDMADRDNMDVAFPSLLETVLNECRTANVPVGLNDPVTGARSDLIVFGELMETEYDVPRSLEDQRLLRLAAAIRVHVLESFQA